MAKPTARQPRSTPATPRTTPPLTPAPNNGQAFSLATEAEQPAAPARKKTNHQLGTRIPLDLYERLLACSEDTGVPITRLVTRAIEAEVSRLEKAKP